MDIVCKNFEIKNVAKLRKSSKQRFNWELDIENESFVITLIVSWFSNIRRVLINDKLIEKSENKGTIFFWSQKIKGYELEIKQNKKEFTFFIDGNEFLFIKKFGKFIKKETERLAKLNQFLDEMSIPDERVPKIINEQKNKKGIYEKKFENISKLVSGESHFEEFKFSQNNDFGKFCTIGNSKKLVADQSSDHCNFLKSDFSNFEMKKSESQENKYFKSGTFGMFER